MSECAFFAEFSPNALPLHALLDQDWSSALYDMVTDIMQSLDRAAMLHAILEIPVSHFPTSNVGLFELGNTDAIFYPVPIIEIVFKARVEEAKCLSSTRRHCSDAGSAIKSSFVQYVPEKA
jgi:hypothetical protein